MCSNAFVVFVFGVVLSSLSVSVSVSLFSLCIGVVIGIFVCVLVFAFVGGLKQRYKCRNVLAKIRGNATSIR